MKVFAFSGSLRTGSFNTRLLTLAAGQLKQHGVEVDVWDFRAAQVPLYDADSSDTNYPASLVDAKTRIRAASGILICTPEYNRGLPGVVKNLFDFLSRPPKEGPLFRGKVFARMGATPGPYGTLNAQAQLIGLLDAFGGWSLPTPFLLPSADKAFDEAGQLHDEKKKAELAAFLDRYVAALGALSK